MHDFIRTPTAAKPAQNQADSNALSDSKQKSMKTQHFKRLRMPVMAASSCALVAALMLTGCQADTRAANTDSSSTEQQAVEQSDNSNDTVSENDNIDVSKLRILAVSSNWMMADSTMNVKLDDIAYNPETRQYYLDIHIQNDSDDTAELHMPVAIWHDSQCIGVSYIDCDGIAGKQETQFGIAMLGSSDELDSLRTDRQMADNQSWSIMIGNTTENKSELIFS